MRNNFELAHRVSSELVPLGALLNTAEGNAVLARRRPHLHRPRLPANTDQRAFLTVDQSSPRVSAR